MMRRHPLDLSKAITSSFPLRKKGRFFLVLDSYTFAANLNFMTAVRMIYLVQHGFPPVVIGLLETLRLVMQLLAEIPTGIFADLVGKRRSLACFCTLIALHSGLFLLPTTPLIVLSYVFAGVAWAFRGGANDALLWQIALTSQPAQATARYSQLASRTALIGAASSMLGPALGGIFGNVLAILPFVATALLSLLALVPLHFLPEPPTLAEASPSRPHPLSYLTEGCRALWRDPLLLGLILLSALASSCWHTIFFFSQLYLQSFGLPLPRIGLVIALSTASYGVWTACAPRVMRWLPPRILLPSCLVVEMSGLLLMYPPWPMLNFLGYLVLLQAGEALLSLTLGAQINRRSPHRQRVTVLSCKTALFDAAMVVLFPLFGLGISTATFSTVYLWTLGAFLVGCASIWGGTRLLCVLRERRSAPLVHPGEPWTPLDDEEAARSSQVSP